MNSPSATSHAAAATEASATLFLVPRAIDRVNEGRRLAAPRLCGAEAESDIALAVRGVHPDLIELAPPEKKERIGIDQVREVIRLTQFSPVQARRKVCLIPRAEALTPEAANALLKIMEEPPRDLAFVLLAEHPGDLLPTIQSRCRMVRVPPPSRATIVRRLADAGYAEPSADWLLRVALRDGDLDRLIETRCNVATERDSAAADLQDAASVDLIATALGDEPVRRYEALLQLVDRIGAREPDLLTVGVRMLAAQDRDGLVRFLQELLAACSDLVRSPLDPTGDRQALLAIHDRIGMDRLRSLCEAIDDAYRSLVVYGPPEPVLLALMLMPGDDADGN